MNIFHRIWFQNFRQFSNLFSQIWLKGDTRHSFLEFVAKSGQIFIKNSQEKRLRPKKNAKFDVKNEKTEIPSRKNVDDFWLKFEIWAVQKYVNLVDLVKSFPTSILIY